MYAYHVFYLFIYVFFYSLFILRYLLLFIYVFRGVRSRLPTDECSVCVCESCGSFVRASSTRNKRERIRVDARNKRDNRETMMENKKRETKRNRDKQAPRDHENEDSRPRCVRDDREKQRLQHNFRLRTTIKIDHSASKRPSHSKTDTLLPDRGEQND